MFEGLVHSAASLIVHCLPHANELAPFITTGDRQFAYSKNVFVCSCVSMHECSTICMRSSFEILHLSSAHLFIARALFVNTSVPDQEGRW